MRPEHRILDVPALKHLREGMAHEFGHALLALRGAGGGRFLGLARPAGPPAPPPALTGTDPDYQRVRRISSTR